MNDRDYGEFLRGAIEEDDQLREGLTLHKDFMEKIGESLPADETIKVGRMIDSLIGCVIVQHLEAARLHPEGVPEVAEFIRQKTIEKLNEMGGD